MKWNFLLIGITGDLAKRKILPALSQFSNKNPEIEINLYGYSRSEPNRQEIEDILGNHNLKSINFIQGEYSDPTFFIDLFNKTPQDEKLVAYFAIPPHVFLDLLKTFCPYNTHNLDILIEKPFGQDLNEAKEIINKVIECKLERNVHFCDHYLFKEALDLNSDIQENLRKLAENKVSKIEIRALEKVDVKGRAGYFDSVGSIKDMIPAHFYSLWFILNKYGITDKKLNDLEIKDIRLAQYKGYLEDIEKEESNTETYFKINGDLRGTEVTFESGKYLQQKLTEIDIFFENGEKVNWNIDPEKNLVINENQAISLNRSNNLDHTNLFEDIRNNSHDRFLNESDAINGWLFYEKIRDFIESNKPDLEIY